MQKLKNEKEKLQIDDKTVAELLLEQAKLQDRIYKVEGVSSFASASAGPSSSSYSKQVFNRRLNSNFYNTENPFLQSSEASTNKKFNAAKTMDKQFLTNVIKHADSHNRAIIRQRQQQDSSVKIKKKKKTRWDDKSG